MNALLKSVSRSFYLSIRFLPSPLREPIALAYLLARATDTVADSANVLAAARLTTLDLLAKVIAGKENFSEVAENLRSFARQQSQPNEKELIERLGEVLASLERVPPADRADIRAVLQTIVRGQELDLERFGDSSTAGALETAEELDEYTYLVAGCVGEFWTRIGFRDLPPFARRPPDEMCALGIAYGKGLQLINVLRDRGADLRNGRDYLPASELINDSLENVFARWLERAEAGVRAGIEYSVALTNWRVRFATVLPALIGARTIALLRVAGPTDEKLKISRSEVRSILVRAAFATRSAARLRKLFENLSAESSG